MKSKTPHLPKNFLLCINNMDQFVTCYIKLYIIFTKKIFFKKNTSIKFRNKKRNLKSLQNYMNMNLVYMHDYSIGWTRLIKLIACMTFQKFFNFIYHAFLFYKSCMYLTFHLFHWVSVLRWQLFGFPCFSVFLLFLEFFMPPMVILIPFTGI